MLHLKALLATIAVFSIFTSLPIATKCDTSYYEKFYTARRFLPPKRSSLVRYNFTVTLGATEQLTTFEQLALTGNQAHLGKWRAAKAVLLNRTQEHNVWSCSLELSANSTVSYRYFIASMNNDTGTLQVRRWESRIKARSFNISIIEGNRQDTFGWISPAKYEVQRGWLHAGHVVQLKLFRQPLVFNESLGTDLQLRVKLQPVDPQTHTPLLPSARAYTEYVRMAIGDSWLRPQPEFGVPYQYDDILIFQTTLSDMKRVAYVLKFYATNVGSELVQLIGYQYIHPNEFAGSEGDLTIKLISPVWLHTIGSLALKYLVIAPMVNGSVDFRTTFMDYWRSNWTELDVGHRGLGKSLKHDSNAPAITENTIASLKAAGDLGADMVEFDVQLTSDLIPIIYHDYAVYVCMDPKKPTSASDLTRVLIKDVTYWQLRNLKTYQVAGNKIVEYPAHNNVEHEDYRLFPLFEDVLTKVNASLGFDIEIKWPQMLNNGAIAESTQTIDKNVYVDRILEVMQRHGCGRLSFFTSFDADICTLLRYKQNMYPVLFLSPRLEQYYADPRSDTVYDAINNAQAFDLAGIVPNAIALHNESDWLQLARKQNKHVFLWGDALKDTNTIAWYKQQQPTGVVYDRLDLRLPLGKRSAFEMEVDLPGYFLQQCPSKPKHAVGDATGGNSTSENALNNVNL